MMRWGVDSRGSSGEAAADDAVGRRQQGERRGGDSRGRSGEAAAGGAAGRRQRMMRWEGEEKLIIVE
jgi:hypothetical protein